LSPQGFILGLVWGALYGLYVAVIFVPLFNFFELRRGRIPIDRGNA